MTQLIREGAVTPDRDFLIREDETGLSAKLNLLATEIAAEGGSDPRAPVYCISGPWGSGKSSALRVLQARLEGDLKEGVSFAHFRAPLHDAAGRSVREGLLIELALGLPPERLQTLAELHGFDPDPLDSTTNARARTKLFDVFSKLTQSPIGFEALLATELREIIQGDDANDSFRYVVFVEDLDRTSDQYTADLLTALTFWREVCGVAFVIACGREHLAAAARLLPSGANAIDEPDPLPKHVHTTIDLPMLVDNDAKALAFAEHLLVELQETADLADAEADDQAAVPGVDDPQDQAHANEPSIDLTDTAPTRGVDMLLELIRGEAERTKRKNERGGAGTDIAGEPALLAPLANLRNPRAIIGALNRLLVEFGSSATAPDSFMQKRYIARAIWPSQFKELVPLTAPDAHSSASQIGQWSYYTASLSLAQASKLTSDAATTLAVAASESHLDLEPWPIEMLLYLAEEPLIGPGASIGPGRVLQKAALRSDGERSRDSASSVLESEFAQSDLGTPFDPQLLSPDALAPDAVFASDPGNDPGRELNDELRRLYYRLDGADSAERAEPARNFVQYVEENFEAILGGGPGNAVTMGNAALRLSALDREIAMRYHTIAHQLEPAHANIRQNFAEFILDNYAEAGRESAQAALEHIRWVQENATTHKPERNAHLLFRSLAQLPDNDQELRGLLPVASEYASPSLPFTNELIHSLVKDLGWIDEAETHAQAACAAVPTRAFSLLRAWSDKLATEPTGSEAEKLAADVYRWLCCSSGLAFDDDQEHHFDNPSADTGHNFATLMYAFDHDECAGLIWRYLYLEDAGEETVRRGYAQYLANYERDTKTAALVIDGQPIPKEMPTPEEAVRLAASLPNWFDPSPGEPWWEQYVGSAEARAVQQDHFLGAFAVELSTAVEA